MRAHPVVPRVIDHGTRRRRAACRRALWTVAELAVTLGLVLLLLVVHQLWWTNRQAKETAQRQVEALEREWAAAPEDGAPSTALPAPGAEDAEGATGGAEGASGATESRRPLTAPEPDQQASPTSPRGRQAYAVLTVPRLHLRVPVAEGVGRTTVLDNGYVGHYPRTAQPGRPGNFALAGHRNTHGEPFRYLNRLRRGDEVRVETRTAVYTYVVDRTLPQTSPRDGGVLRAVPRSTARPSYGYDEPGHYLTLTTCTPEYTSTYRLVVWGKLRSVRVR